MNKITIAALIGLFLGVGATQAEYTVKQPLEQALGGSLPSGSIRFNNQETSTTNEGDWIPTDRYYLEDWQATGNLLSCIIDPYDNEYMGPFYKTCVETESRKYKEREINTATGEYRLPEMIDIRGQALEYKNETRYEKQVTVNLPADCRYQSPEFMIYTHNIDGGFNWFQWSNLAEGYNHTNANVIGNNYTYSQYIYFRGSYIDTTEAIFNGISTTRDNFQICQINTTYLP